MPPRAGPPGGERLRAAARDSLPAGGSAALHPELHRGGAAGRHCSAKACPTRAAAGRRLTVLIAAAQAVPGVRKVPPEVQVILEKARRGAAHGALPCWGVCRSS